jgi:hypothetical protein
MATKKGKAAKRKAANETEKPDLTDQEIFDIFGVGTETASQPLRKFISGQRKINGHLYTAIDKILDHLTVTQGKAGDPDLEEAKKRSDAVPDVPPACNRGDASGGPGGNG